MSPSLPKFLVNIASITGLLGISLFYIGWIYRWSYYAYFQLEITTLDFPFQSFLFVPLQVLFGTRHTIANTVIATLLSISFIWLTYNFISFLLKFITQLKTRLNPNQETNTNSVSNNPNKTVPLQKEVIIIFWVLFILFHLAQTQGLIDARRDVVNENSTLPAVALIGARNNLVLGKSLPTLDPQQFSFWNHLLISLTGKGFQRFEVSKILWQKLKLPSP